jgi:hypothetical protein
MPFPVIGRETMHRHFAALCLTLLSTLVAFAALALPAPMSQEELLTKSDLVALVRVLSVTCVSVGNDAQSGEALPSYRAKANLIEVIKGDEAKGSDVTIAFNAVPAGVLGPWSVYYYPGEMVWTHLVHDGDAYTTTWWNGRGTLVSKAVINALPTKPGETVEIPKRTN